MSALAQVADLPAMDLDGQWLVPLTFATSEGTTQILLGRTEAAELASALLMAAAGVFPVQTTPEARGAGLEQA